MPDIRVGWPKEPAGSPSIRLKIKEGNKIKSNRIFIKQSIKKEL
jgi:hypothetical protein